MEELSTALIAGQRAVDLATARQRGSTDFLNVVRDAE